VAELTPWRVARLADKAPIRAFLNRDRALTAYAIGDLDDAWHLTRLFEAFRYGPEGQPIPLQEFRPPSRG